MSRGKKIRPIRDPAVLWITAALVASCTGTADHTDDSTPETPTATATVTRQDLTAHDELAGSLGYEDPAPLVASRDGVVTWLPEEGAVVGRGEVLAEIDGAATRLLIGRRPAWRRMAVGEPDGPDITQLNDNLAASGYAPRDALPDERFDWRTREAVSRWQADLGVQRTGAVEAGDVVFLPSAVRIGAIEAGLGSLVAPGESLATVTGTEHVVTLQVDVQGRGDVPEDSTVTILLPDGTRVDGTIRSVGRAASAPGEPGEETSDQEPTIQVEIEPSGLPEDFELDVSPVVVIVERVLASDALTVPVGALMARPGGGYSVERVDPAGQPELVTVDPGQFAGGLVEVTGDLTEGDEVVVPS